MRNTFRSIVIVGSIVGAVLGIAALYFSSVFGLNNGGTVTITEPPGAIHIHTQWKQQSIWHEYYLPSNDTCVTQEVSKFGLVEGTIVVEHCNYINQK